MKMNLQPDHIRQNKYQFVVSGLAPLTVLSVTGLKEELDKAQLPDRTQSTGGRTKPVEFEIMLPMHHLEEQVAMETWYKENQDPVSPTAKKTVTFTLISGTGARQRSYTLLGVWPTGRGLPDATEDDEGGLAQTTWPMSTDQIIPVP